jgi:putative tricarboxylic transport membrane protein
LMRKVDFEPAPLVVGLVLGPVMERSFRQTMIISKGNMNGLWESPLCMIMWLVALLALVLPFVMRVVRAKRAARS